MKIIALEGIDGAGKTTLLNRLKSSPRLSGLAFTGEFSSEIGALLRDRCDWLSDPIIKIYAFAADRAVTYSYFQRVRSTNDVVIWDRYIYSALAYREAEMRLGRSRYGRREAEIVNHLFQPAHAIIYLDIPVDIAILRRHGDPEILQCVKGCYREILSSANIPYWIIDASQDQESVFVATEEVILREFS